MKNSKLQFKIILVSAFLISMPLLVSAKGLVPCGGEPPEIPCNLCHLAVMADNIIKFLLFVLVLPAGTLALIIAGILILTAGGSDDQITKGKTVFKQVVIGLLIAFSAWLIVGTILGNLLKTRYLPWNKFPENKCYLFN
ncbi:pilin [Patescibacteria group bacterium]|nr:pilin [Patescibacteria group bacterium]